MKPTTGYDFTTIPMIGIFLIYAFFYVHTDKKESFFTHVTRF